MAQMKPLLDVAGLTISYRIGNTWLQAVRDFRLQLQRGHIVGLVGESGSGKSTVALALMRYLGANGRVEPGAKMVFAGEDLLGKHPSEMRSIWAQRIKLVPQNPGAALNPSMRIGPQVLEGLKAAKGVSGAEAERAMLQMFHDVNLADPEEVAARFPHELSGGMQQRVIIAMALITDPELLILDEPTTGLDVTTEAVILELIRELIAERDTSVIYITHNLGVVAQLCERVLVLYAGEIMEDATVDALYAQPNHPYTLGLLNSVPVPGQSKRDAPLHSIEGNPPSLAQLSGGCVFADRCDFVIDLCRTSKPPLEQLEDGRWVRCHRWPEVNPTPKPPPRGFKEGERVIRAPREAEISQAASQAEASQEKSPSHLVGEGFREGGHSGETLMIATDLKKHFPVTQGFGDFLRGQQPAPIRAVDGVNLALQAGQTLGLVGESGSGKTTLSRLIVGLQTRTGGKLQLLGMDIRNDVRDRSHDVLSKIQMVFQNPQNSLNPYLSVRQSLRRPLIKLRGLTPDEADAEVLELLRRVNLRADYAERFPDALSGGEKQRVVIARAFASDPDLIICDEPVSALDVSVQSAVLNLLAHLQDENGTAYLFISHNLAVVGYLADKIAVMYLGQLFEVGAGADLFQPPFHPYTEALVSAIPVPDPQHKTHRILLHDNLPSAQHLPIGCRFHTRCPRKIGAICEDEPPPWREAGAGHAIRCHIPLEELLEAQGSGGLDVLKTDER